MDNLVQAGMIGGAQIILILFFLVAFGFWIKTIIEIINSKFKDDSKTIWILVVILLGLLGMIIYYIAGRSKRDLNPGTSSDILDEDGF